MPYIAPLIPESPPQAQRCECGRWLRRSTTGLCKTCEGRQDTHRRRDDPWARVLR